MRLLFSLLTLSFGLTLACAETGTRRVGETCTHTDECSDGICGQGHCLAPHTVRLPEAPALTGISPPSPSYETDPTLTGYAFPGETVSIYSDDTCKSLLGTGVADKTGRFAIQVEVTPNSTQHFYLQGSAGTLSSHCVVGGLPYTHSDALPDAPTLIEAIPPSPSPSLTPYFVGKTTPFASVALSLDAQCEVPVHAVQAVEDGLFVAQLTLTEDSTTAVYARATTLAGTRGDCLLLTEYTHAWGAPVAPWLSPEQQAALPESSADPLILRFCAASGATPHVYDNPDCAGAALDLTPQSDASCGNGDAYQLEALGSLWAQSTDPYGQASDCSLLAEIRPSHGDAELEIRSVRAKNWHLEDGAISRSDFEIGGFTRPHAHLHFIYDGSGTFEAQADDTGRFNALIPNIATPEHTEVALEVVALADADGGSAPQPFADTQILLAGTFELHVIYQDLPVPHLDYLLHLPNEQVLRSHQGDSNGRIRFHVVAGMGLSTYFADGPTLFSSNTIYLDTIMDLTPGASLTQDYTDSWRRPCQNSRCAPPSDVVIDEAPLFLDFEIPEPPEGTDVVDLWDPCTNLSIFVGDSSDPWPRIYSEYTYAAQSCYSGLESSVFLALAMDESYTPIAYAEYQGSLAEQPLQLGPWTPLPAENDAALDILNDTDEAWGLGGFQHVLFHEVGSGLWQTIYHLRTDFDHGDLLPGAARTLAYPTPPSLNRSLIELNSIRGPEDSLVISYTYLPAPEPHDTFNLSQLLPAQPVHHESDLDDETYHLSLDANPAFDKGTAAIHQSAWRLCLPCATPEDCSPCRIPDGDDPGEFCVVVNWSRAANPWGDISFHEDPSILAPVIPINFRHLLTYDTWTSGSLRLLNIIGAAPWSQLLRQLRVPTLDAVNDAEHLLSLYPNSVIELSMFGVMFGE